MLFFLCSSATGLDVLRTCCNRKGQNVSEMVSSVVETLVAMKLDAEKIKRYVGIEVEMKPHV